MPTNSHTVRTKPKPGIANLLRGFERPRCAGELQWKMELALRINLILEALGPDLTQQSALCIFDRMTQEGLRLDLRTGHYYF